MRFRATGKHFASGFGTQLFHAVLPIKISTVTHRRLWILIPRATTYVNICKINKRTLQRCERYRARILGLTRSLWRCCPSGEKIRFRVSEDVNLPCWKIDRVNCYDGIVLATLRGRCITSIASLVILHVSHGGNDDDDDDTTYARRRVARCEKTMELRYDESLISVGIKRRMEGGRIKRRIKRSRTHTTHGEARARGRKRETERGRRRRDGNGRGWAVGLTWGSI